MGREKRGRRREGEGGRGGDRGGERKGERERERDKEIERGKERERKRGRERGREREGKTERHEITQTSTADDFLPYEVAKKLQTIPANAHSLD